MNALLGTLPGGWWPVTGALGVCVAALAVYWALRVAREARGRRVPRAAYWAVPGLAALLAAAIVDVPALFGVGAAALVFAEYWPDAYRRRAARPDAAWPAVGVVLGGAALLAAVQQGAALLLVAGLAVTLAGGAGLLAAAAYPRARTVLTFQSRWNAVQEPEWPELNVTLSERGAHLKNVTRGKLLLAGWSPAGVNAWYRVRGEDGEVISELRAGQVALLPVGAWDSGVRVWYAAAPRTDASRVFRADWTPAARAAERVLN